MRKRHHHRRGFSLIELAIVLAISGVILGMVLKLTDTAGTQECYANTSKQLNDIREAIERFAMKNDRFPLPARRNVGVDSPTFGREVALADVATQLDVVGTTGGGAVFGALPFQALGIPFANAADCFGNKLTYVVTKDLADPTDPKKFLTPGTAGAIQIKASATDVFLAEAGYAIISHGADQLGAVKNNYNAATNTLATRKWCTSTAELRTENCDVTNNAIVSSVYNDGKTAAANYFDDVVVYRGKPWRVAAAAAPTAGGNAFCWGDNSYGQIGDNTLTQRLVPTLTTMPVGRTFTDIQASDYHTCAIDDLGKAWCWGYNAGYILGDGTTTNRRVPVAVTMPIGRTFVGIALAQSSTCAIDDLGKAWCWAYNHVGQLGDGTTTDRSAPTAVTMPVGRTFQQISSGMTYFCAIDDLGKAWCWGGGVESQLGNGTTTNRNVPTAVTMPVGRTFVEISAGAMTTCAIDDLGKAWCWGYGDYGRLGDGTNVSGYYKALPTAVIMPVGRTFVDIGAGSNHTCAIDDLGKAWCWGYNTGEIGDGTQFNYRIVPTATIMPVGRKFVSIIASNYYTCAIDDLSKEWCWGAGGGYIGNGLAAGWPTPTYFMTPTAVTMPTGINFTRTNTSGNTTCAIAAP
jgi:prepilin-type N-terminal cleavage/methylation domain-containing protein